MSVETTPAGYADILERAAKRDRYRIAFLAVLWTVGAAAVALAVWRWSARLNGLETRVDSVDSKLAETVRHSEKLLADAQKELVRIQGPLAAVQASIAKSYGELSGLQAAQDHVALALRNELEARRSEVAILSNTASGLKADLKDAEDRLKEIHDQLRGARKDLDAVMQTSIQQFRTNRWDQLAGTDLHFGLGNWKSGGNGIDRFCVSMTEEGSCLSLKTPNGATLPAFAPLRFGEKVLLEVAPCRYTLVAKPGARVQFSRADQVQFEIRCEPLQPRTP